MECVSALFQGQAKEEMGPLALLGGVGESITQEVIFELGLSKKNVPGKKNPLRRARFGEGRGVFRMAIYQ